MKDENKKSTETRAPTSHIAPFGLRMQPELREKLEESASKNGRSLNAELIARLESSFQTKKSLSVDDLIKELIERFPLGTIEIKIGNSDRDA